MSVARATGPLAAVTAGEAMRPGVLTVAAGAPLDDVARRMVSAGVHAVLVRPGDPRALGWPSHLVTDLDVVRWMASGTPAGGCALTAASVPVGVLAPDETLDAAARVMDELGRTHVLVAGRRSILPEGVLSSFDLVAVLGGREPRLARLARPGPARPALVGRRLDRVVVADVMHDGVIACTADASLPAVAAALADYRIHCVAVVGDHLGPFSGFVDTLAVVRAARGTDARRTAGDLAARDPLAVDERAMVLDAARLMAEHRVAHLLVTGGTGEPTGVVSSLDLASACATGA